MNTARQEVQIEKDIRRMSRRELLELLLQQLEKNKVLEQQLDEAKEELSVRQIDVSECGTMAEAALKLNRVFQDADEAVKQYQENIERYSHKAEYAEAEVRQKAIDEARRILTLAKEKADEMEEEASRKARRIQSASEENLKREKQEINRLKERYRQWSAVMDFTEEHTR